MLGFKIGEDRSTSEDKKVSKTLSHMQAKMGKTT
jgi:hypothetical protein